MTKEIGHILFADALIFVHGEGAEAEAVRHAQLCEHSGDRETAATWRKVQTAIHRMPSNNDLLCAA